MKYELIGDNHFFDPVKTVLGNRGIEDIKEYLNVNETSVNHWSKLDNISAAVDCLIRHIKGGGKVFVQVDADP